MSDLQKKEKKQPYFTIYRIAFIAVMAAVIYVVTLFRFPLLGSKVHFANTMCLLSGLLFGPIGGGLAAGLGSGLYDLIAGGYGLDTVLITTVSKFLMAAICALVAGTYNNSQRQTLSSDKKSGLAATYKEILHCAPRIMVGSIVGALSYVGLYMLKTFVYQRFVYGFPSSTVWATMASKLPASLINALLAMVVAPILYAAIFPALRNAGLTKKL